MVGNQQCNCKGRGLTALLCTIHRCALRVYPKPPKSSRSQLYTVGIVLSSLCRVFKICTLGNVEKTGFYIAMAKNFCVGKMFFVRLGTVLYPCSETCPRRERSAARAVAQCAPYVVALLQCGHGGHWCVT